MTAGSLAPRAGGGKMISLKKYLENDSPLPDQSESSTLSAMLSAYGSAMLAMGNCSVDACPGAGMELKQRLTEIQEKLSLRMSAAEVESTGLAVRTQLSDWGQRTAHHYRDKAAEVREILLTMARAGEAVGARDKRCAERMSQVTERLSRITTLEDISEIRSSIEKSAADLKGAIDRMTAAGKAAQEELKGQLSRFQSRLEEAEELASRDALTGVRNRMCLESIIDSRIQSGAGFCVAMIDLDGFKKVNDTYGHLAGDELLRQFAAELRSTCRSTDIIGRWGGDEFVVVLDRAFADASEQINRLRKWICGEYTVNAKSGSMKLRLDASIGLAEHLPQESIETLMERADAAMYQHKGAGRPAGAT